MKHVLLIALSLILVFSVAACGQKEPEEAAPAGLGSSVQIANPFSECETVDDAAEIAGFSVTAPDSIPDFAGETVIRAMGNQMIEIIYTGEQELRVRKAAGSEDISGSYETYEEVKDIPVGDLTVTVKGNGGKVYVAVWADGDFSYSVSADAGLTQAAAEELIADIH